jgi:hypothetical protein
MYQKFTRERPDEYCDVIKEKESFGFLSPKKETIAFIMQFAYTYHVEKKLPVELSGMILN